MEIKEVYGFDVVLKETEKVEKQRKVRNKDEYKTYLEDVEIEVPYRISIKKSTRSERDAADLFYSKRFNFYVKEGILTAAQIARKNLQEGGPMSEEEQLDYNKAQYRYYELTRELEMVETVLDDKSSVDPKRKELLGELNTLRGVIADYEYIRNSVYEQSADVKAKNDVIEWWSLNNTFVLKKKDEKEEEAYQPLFKGESFEDKRVYLESLEDKEDELFLKSWWDITKIVSIWVMVGDKDISLLESLLAEQEQDAKDSDVK